MNRLFQNSRRTWLSLGAIVGGMALFASGAFVATALGGDSDDDDGDSPAGVNKIEPGAPIGSAPVPAIARPAGLGHATTGEGDAAGDSRMSYPAHACNAPIPGVFKDGKIDPALAGFAASYLGSAFDLTGFTVRGQAAECKDGSPTGAVVTVVDTQWKHRDTGLAVYVNQFQDTKAKAAVLEETNARFSKDGYSFNVGVEGYSAQPLGRGTDDKPLIAGPDPRAKDVLRAALADLQAPAESCFYVARQGSWEDLAAAGIGDPRGAIPANFAFQDLHVTAWTAPGAGCNTPSEGLGIFFNATWNYTGTDRGFGALYISATSIEPQAGRYPGYSGDFGASWSNERYQFNVGYKVERQEGLDRTALLAIARSLDPKFDSACMMREQQLSEAEMAALGIASPSASGYASKAVALVTTKLSGDCAGYEQSGLEPQTRAHWQLRNGSAVIEVTAYKHSGMSVPEKEQGWISDSSISWFSGSVSYGVHGWVEGSGSPPSRDTLIEVAKSMDPSFDPASLSEQPGGGGSPGSPPVKPMPASDLPATR